MASKAEINAQLFGYRPNRGDSTRLRILEAAIHLMANDGLEAITFDVLGEQVGLGKANVRYHFKHKHDIFLAAIKFIVLTAQEISVAEISKAHTPDQQLTAEIGAAFLWFEKYPEQARVWLLFWSLCTRNQEYMELHHRVRVSGAERLAAILQSFKATRMYEKQALTFARHIQKLISAELAEHLTCQYPEKLRERMKRLVAKIKKDLAVEGIKWKES